jgi:hypothetical protein
MGRRSSRTGDGADDEVQSYIRRIRWVLGVDGRAGSAGPNSERIEALVVVLAERLLVRTGGPTDDDSVEEMAMAMFRGGLAALPPEADSPPELKIFAARPGTKKGRRSS